MIQLAFYRYFMRNAAVLPIERLQFHARHSRRRESKSPQPPFITSESGQKKRQQQIAERLDGDRPTASIVPKIKERWKPSLKDEDIRECQGREPGDGPSDRPPEESMERCYRQQHAEKVNRIDSGEPIDGICAIADRLRGILIGQDKAGQDEEDGHADGALIDDVGHEAPMNIRPAVHMKQENVKRRESS